eukprot:1147029-Pelagomonas_calceolata.AAC.2
MEQALNTNREGQELLDCMIPNLGTTSGKRKELWARGLALYQAALLSFLSSSSVIFSILFVTYLLPHLVRGKDGDEGVWARDLSLNQAPCSHARQHMRARLQCPACMEVHGVLDVCACICECVCECVCVCVRARACACHWAEVNEVEVRRWGALGAFGCLHTEG